MRVDARSFVLETVQPVAPGDGLCFLTRKGLVGTNVNAVEGTRIVPNRMEGIEAGAEVYRNSDRLFTLRVERSRTRRVIPARMVVEASAEGVRMTCSDAEGFTATAFRQAALTAAQRPDANVGSLRTQAARSGEWFVPASLAAEVRREVLEALLRERTAQPPEHRILPENRAARYPSERLAAEENVTNRLAEAFYRDHGVREIARGLDLEPTTVGHVVLRTAYCIRREIGECLLRRPRLRGELWLERGRSRYRLDFDCARCEMSLVDCTGMAEGANEREKP